MTRLSKKWHNFVTTEKIVKVLKLPASIWVKNRNKGIKEIKEDPVVRIYPFDKAWIY